MIGPHYVAPATDASDLASQADECLLFLQLALGALARPLGFLEIGNVLHGARGEDRPSGVIRDDLGAFDDPLFFPAGCDDAVLELERAGLLKPLGPGLKKPVAVVGVDQVEKGLFRAFEIGALDLEDRKDSIAPCEDIPLEVDLPASELTDFLRAQQLPPGLAFALERHLGLRFGSLAAVRHVVERPSQRGNLVASLRQGRAAGEVARFQFASGPRQPFDRRCHQALAPIPDGSHRKRGQPEQR